MAGGSQFSLPSFDAAQDSSAGKSISRWRTSKIRRWSRLPIAIGWTIFLVGFPTPVMSTVGYPSLSSIPSVGGESAASSISAQPVLPGSSGSSFENLVGDFVNDVSAQQAAGSNAVNGLMSGKNVSLHQAMISMEEASVSFQMMVEVRNKVLDSYQELMRMSV